MAAALSLRPPRPASGTLGGAGWASCPAPGSTALASRWHWHAMQVVPGLLFRYGEGREKVPQLKKFVAWIMREICLLAVAAAAVSPCLGSVTWLLPVSAASRCPQATLRFTLGNGANVWRCLVRVEQIVLKASMGKTDHQFLPLERWGFFLSSGLCSYWAGYPLAISKNSWGDLGFNSSHGQAYS